MENDITYIGIEPEKEPNKNSNKEVKKEKFKTKKHSISLSRFISKTKRHIINKKVLLLLLIIIILYFFNPITFLQEKLDQKREFYANSEPLELSADGLWDSVVYASGYDYYKNCKDTMVAPADGLITCQYDFGHQGIDIACENYKDNVYAAANGYVCYVGYDEKYGNDLMIEHQINGITLYTYYANLSIIHVKNGDYVYQNQVIAQEGGNPDRRAQVLDTDGHHIHFEVRKDKNSGGLNPNIFIVN